MKLLTQNGKGRIMKNKLQKALSLLLSIIMVFSVGVFDLSSKAEATVTYYVGDNTTGSQDGTPQSPFSTISAAIKKAVDLGYKKDDTVELKVTSYVDWGDQIDHAFDLEISSNEDYKIQINFPAEMCFGGNVAFSKIILQATTVYFNDHNISFDDDCTLLGDNYYLGGQNGQSATSQGQVANFGTYFSKNIFITDKTLTNKVYNNDLNLVVNDILSTPKNLLNSTIRKRVF